MKKRMPSLRSDADAEAFFEKDLSDYIDPDHMAPMRFEFEAKNKAVNLRLSEGLLTAVKERARRRNMPYQRFIRMVLEQEIRSGKSKP